MAALFSAETDDGAGTGASHTGACTVVLSGTLDGAIVEVELATADTDALYGFCGVRFNDSTPLRCANVSGNGTYYLRGRISNAGANTSVTLTTVQ
jgi:hypothetical protein